MFYADARLRATESAYTQDMGMKAVFTTTSLQDAELLRVELRSQGIESLLENEHGAQSAIGLPTTLIPLIVSVDEAQFAEAERAVKAWESGEKSAEPMPDFVSAACAACGKALDVPKGEPLPDECPWCGKPPGAA